MSNQEQAQQLFFAALAAQNAGRLAKAEQLYREALALAPGRPSLLNNLASVLRDLSRHEEALNMSAALVLAAPGDAQSWITRASIYTALGDSLSAASDLLQATRLDPENAALQLLLGTTLLEGGQPGQAIRCLRQVFSAQPGDPQAACQLANALLRAFQPDEAIHCCDKALALDPRHADAWLNRANALLQLGRYDEALHGYSNVQQLAPGSPRAWWNESLLRLLLGDLERGWKLYEYGWATGQRGMQRPRFTAPAWDGRPLEGDLLVWAEQGIGDQILFGTMLEELRPLARQVIVAAAPRLLPLLQRSLPGLRFVSGEAVDPQLPVAAQAAMGDLGGFLRGSADRFPQRAGYLRADAARAAALRARLLPADQRLLVGLSWRSRNDHFGALKSLDPGQLAPLLALPGITAVDLQYGDTAAERAMLQQKHGITLQHCDDIDNFNDLDGLAALIEACDVVVSVSNTTVHLAGALGKPTLVLLPFALGRIWYWHQHGERSLWYPSCRLLRQPQPGDWASPVAQALAEINKLLN
ncbi:MAG: tetratricopeptide repeat protein [Betaproteobacteria bacterium]|nr:tetratricopeptide repeat protein [Betaproteobacteria bacterium]